MSIAHFVELGVILVALFSVGTLVLQVAAMVIGIGAVGIFSLIKGIVNWFKNEPPVQQ